LLRAVTCKASNDPLTCTIDTDFYSGVDPTGVRRECTTGKPMKCYTAPNRRLIWQDGPVIKYGDTGEVCPNCPPPQAPQPTDPAGAPDPGPVKLQGHSPKSGKAMPIRTGAVHARWARSP